MAEWFDRVYNDPLYLELYEAEDTARAPEEVAGALRLGMPPRGGRWLEVCCGFGRHAELLAKDGLEVVGVDRSPMMLDRARQRRARCSPALRLTYLRADVRQLPFVEAFDVASLFFDSFGYFAHERDHVDALLSLALTLKPHAYLLVHQVNRERLLATWPPAVSETRSDVTIRRTSQFDLATGRHRWRQHLVTAGTEHRWDFDVRVYAASELREMLVRAGFDEIEFFGDWQAAAYAPGSPAMITRARKATLADLPPPGA